MTASRKDLAPVIQSIAKSSVPDAARTASVALLNLIPFAGGAVASIIGDVATRKRVQKICDVLADLNQRLESHGLDPTTHLNEDQIIEVVHATLQTVATTSDRAKIEKLKRGLGYAFLNSDSFERKQMFLEVLRALTSLELAVVACVYGPDPHVVRRGAPGPDVEMLPTGLALRVRGHSDALSILGVAGSWVPAGFQDCPDRRSVLSHLATSLHCDEGTARGAASLVDSKGLAALGDHLDETGPCRVLEWTEAAASAVMITSPTALVQDIGRKTPLESSRREFGVQFMRFCDSF